MPITVIRGNNLQRQEFNVTNDSFSWGIKDYLTCLIQKIKRCVFAILEYLGLRKSFSMSDWRFLEVTFTNSMYCLLFKKGNSHGFVTLVPVNRGRNSLHLYLLRPLDVPKDYLTDFALRIVKQAVARHYPSRKITKIYCNSSEVYELAGIIGFKILADALRQPWPNTGQLIPQWPQTWNNLWRNYDGVEEHVSSWKHHFWMESNDDPSSWAGLALLRNPFNPNSANYALLYTDLLPSEITNDAEMLNFFHFIIRRIKNVYNIPGETIQVHHNTPEARDYFTEISRIQILAGIRRSVTACAAEAGRDPFHRPDEFGSGED